MGRAGATLAILGVAACAERSIVVPPSNAPLLFEATAKGSMTYVCAGPEQPVWMGTRWFEEVLYDKQGQVVATAGPHPYRWQANDGSTVTVISIAREPSASRGDLAAQLYAVQTHEGHGLLDRVKTVRWIKAKGGESPGLCKQIGTELRAEYTALYQFYGAGDWQ